MGTPKKMQVGDKEIRQQKEAVEEAATILEVKELQVKEPEAAAAKARHKLEEPGLVDSRDAIKWTFGFVGNGWPSGCLGCLGCLATAKTPANTTYASFPQDASAEFGGSVSRAIDYFGS